MIFNGMRVIASPYLEQDGDPIQVPRTWRERLLTRPWRPWIATRTVIPKIPMQGGLIANNVIYMHPEAIAALRETLRKVVP